MYNEEALLSGIGKRSLVGLFTAVGNFSQGKLNGEASKDYENYERSKYGGFGNFQNEDFIVENDRMTKIGELSFKENIVKILEKRSSLNEID